MEHLCILDSTIQRTSECRSNRHKLKHLLPRQHAVNNLEQLQVQKVEEDSPLGDYPDILDESTSKTKTTSGSGKAKSKKKSGKKSTKEKTTQKEENIQETFEIQVKQQELSDQEDSGHKDKKQSWCKDHKCKKSKKNKKDQESDQEVSKK